MADADISQANPGDMDVNEMEAYIRARDESATHFVWFHDAHLRGLLWTSASSLEEALRYLTVTPGTTCDVYELLTGSGCTHVWP
jgi:hypothetical protein